MKASTSLYKFLKYTFRILKPFIPVVQKYQAAYRRIRTANMYHAVAVNIKDFCFVEKSLKDEPHISIVVPVFNPQKLHFIEMIYSVINQHYSNWELILVNASTDKAIRSYTRDCSQKDVRIKVVDTENEGISANTNRGIQAANGEYVAFLDHDDLLHPCALHSIAEAVQINKNQPDIVYTDEDKINESSSRYSDPHYKPDWSPDLLRNVNYINHLTAIRRECIQKVKGLRPVCDGAQDYDLLLRVVDACSHKIKHVPRVLYHWRATKQSTAQDISNKKYIFKAGEKTLNDHLRRNKINATASSIEGKPGFYEVKYKPVEFSIIIGEVSPVKYEAAAWVDELINIMPKNSELIVGDWYRELSRIGGKEKTNIKFISSEENYWVKAIQASSKEVCICFKIAADPLTQGGLEKLAAVAGNTENTIFSPPIINKQMTIFNSGIVRSGGNTYRLFEGYIFGRSSFFGNTDWVRNVDDLDTAVIAVKTSTIKAVLEDLGTTDYENIHSLESLVTMKDKLQCIVWAHTPFEYIGQLRRKNNNYYHQLQQFRIIPTSIMVMYSDNWGEKYEPDER